ncbi:hypothetical protein H8959_019789 [Pygathrix nigripes]
MYRGRRSGQYAEHGAGSARIPIPAGAADFCTPQRGRRERRRRRVIVTGGPRVISCPNADWPWPHTPAAPFSPEPLPSRTGPCSPALPKLLSSSVRGGSGASRQGFLPGLCGIQSFCLPDVSPPHTWACNTSVPECAGLSFTPRPLHLRSVWKTPNRRHASLVTTFSAFRS